MSITYYRLVNHEAVPCANVIEWAEYYERSNRVVKHDEIDGYVISTVFLGINHNFWGEGPPLLFETMVFKGETTIRRADGTELQVPLSIGYQDRCSTWVQAIAMHARAVEQYTSAARMIKGMVEDGAAADRAQLPSGAGNATNGRR